MYYISSLTCIIVPVYDMEMVLCRSCILHSMIRLILANLCFFSLILFELKTNTLEQFGLNNYFRKDLYLSMYVCTI